MTMRLENPFKVGGLIEGRFISGRSEEVKKISHALVVREGLVVRGHARTGVTTVLRTSVDRVRATGTIAMMANVGSCSVATDLAVRLLQSLNASLGREGPEAVRRIGARAQRRLVIGEADRNGGAVVSLNVRLREETEAEQVETLLAIVAAVDAEAEAMGRSFALVLDDAQALERVVGAGLAALRKSIAGHARICYVMGWKAGDDNRLLGWLQKDRFSVMDLEPMNSETMMRWIDSRMEASGVKPSGAGSQLVRMSGARTGDLLRHARALFEISGTTGAVRAGDVARAFELVIEEMETMIRGEWNRLTAAQQNVLRAVAAGMRQLTGREARVTFGLTTSAAVSQSARALVDKGWLIAVRKGYEFDSPFYKRWVIKSALPDVGIFTGVSGAAESA